MKDHIKAIREAFEGAFRSTGDYLFREQLNNFLNDWDFVVCSECGELCDEYRTDSDGLIECEGCQEHKSLRASDEQDYQSRNF